MAGVSVDRLYEIMLHLSTRSLGFFLDHVCINSSPKPNRWGAIRDRWQTDLINKKIPIFEALAFPERVYNGPWSAATLLARGHDKTSLEGRLATWLLLASRRQIHGYILAADKDQGRLVLQSMIDESRLNPWYAPQLTFTKDTAAGPGGSFEVIPADAGSAFGLRANCIIVDELTSWRKPRAREVWDAVISGSEKISPRIVSVLSNSGTYPGWQYDVVEAIKKNKDYVYTSIPGHSASWMSKERVAELRKMLPESEARRVYDNVWIPAGADNDYLREEEIAACRDASLHYRLRRKPLVANHVASIDYGPKRDRTVMCVGHQDESGRTIIDRMDVLQGSPEAPVHTDRVWGWVTDVYGGFKPLEYVVDPSGMNGVIEKMTASGLPVREFTPRGGAGNFEIAQALRASIASQNVRWYPGCGKLGDSDLESELAHIITKMMPYGFRIDHRHGQHDDRAVALGMLLCRASEYPWALETRGTKVTPLVLKG